MSFLIAKNLIKVRHKIFGVNPSLIQKLISILKLYFLPRKVIYFFPDTPKRWHVVFKLCAVSMYRIVTSDNIKYDSAFKFHTKITKEPYKEINQGRLVINDQSLDISKTTIQNNFQNVFNYSLEVNPTECNKKIVVKSDQNYTHDGRIVQCPIPSTDVDQNLVYQKAVDTKTEEGFFLDYRVPVHGGLIPLVYLKYSTPENRFKNETSHIEIKEPGSVFTQDEIDKILMFTKSMNLDFGELDVLRDNDDGLIYIVDVANTPSGPSSGITPEQQRYSLNLMSKSFKKLIQQFENS
jgi:hypothetical protein